MKIQKLLWMTAAVLLIFILTQSPKERKKEKIKDGTYRNAYMITLSEEQMTVLIDGKQWTISCPVGKEVQKENSIVDIVVEKNKIRGITWKEGQIKDKVEAIDEIKGTIWLKESGQLPLAEEWEGYQKQNGKIKELKESGGLINWEEVLVTVINGRVETVIGVKKPETKYIKVLLHGDRKEVYHKEVRLTASSDFTVQKGENVTSYGAGQEFILTSEEGIYQVHCEKGKIRLLSSERASGFPEYRGDFVIHKGADGYIIRNILPLEEYLYSVVSSEMPSTYPEQALNAQAICARTYALYQMECSYYSPYGANVDDTVNSQVYNNVSETKESRKAVKATQEQYLEYGNSPIPAYFYSTSCGFTSDALDVWIGEGENPAYLKGHFQGEGETEYDLSKEKTFREFIQKGKKGFEEGEAWYRWKGTISLKQMSEHFNKNLASWTKKNPNLYLTSVDGNFVEKEIDSIGDIIDMRVAGRSKGGVIKELEVTGTKGIVKVIGEYQIRKAVCPTDTEITLQDGRMQTLSMLPSAYFYLDLKKGTVNLAGGGYGHGVGLSQNGAKAMANLEYSYEDILNFYYPGITLVYGY